MTTINQLENDLAIRIQKAFPVDPEPFQILAKEFGLEDSEVLKILQRWKEEKNLREISAIMEGSNLGYEGALVCGKIPEDKINAVAEIVNLHPTVTHNYKRVHDYNLWFTISVPLYMGLENHIKKLSERTGFDFFPLRRVKTFKIGVVFDFTKNQNDTSVGVLPEIVNDYRPTDKEIRIIRALQTDLPLTLQPYNALAKKFDLKAEDLIGFLNTNMGSIARKYVATFHHKKMGVKSNGMTVWNVLEEKLDLLGPRLAMNPEVSHCYSRTTFGAFPYNLYSMLHGPDKETVGNVATRISNELGVKDYLVLDSTQEYKKCRLRYFLPELDDWDRGN